MRDHGEEIDVLGGLPSVGRGARRERPALEVVRRPGLCSTCAVLPLSGGENLSPSTGRGEVHPRHVVARQADRLRPEAVEGPADPARVPGVREGPVEVPGFRKESRKVRSAQVPLTAGC